MAILSKEESVGSPVFTQLGESIIVAWTGTNKAHNINIAKTDKDLQIVDKKILGETSDYAPGIATRANTIWLLPTLTRKREFS